MSEIETLNHQIFTPRHYLLRYLIHTSDSVSVYHGEFLTTHTPVAIKILSRLSDADYQKAFKECELQIKFINVTSVVRVYDSFGYCLLGNRWSFVIITEWMDRDLSQEIDRRRLGSSYWSEYELLSILKVIVDTLANLQENHVSHRDVKPQNIFLSSRDGIKLGDFGSARTLDYQKGLVEKYTITGTPFFMSPELKEILILNATRGVYNPYKSDVYSVGVTLIHCWKLAPPIQLLAMQKIEETTCTLLSEMPHKQLRAILSDMLARKPDDRPDFLQLRDRLAEINSCKPQRVTDLFQCPHVLKHECFFRCHCQGLFCVVCGTATHIVSINGVDFYTAICPNCNTVLENAELETCRVEGKTHSFESEVSEKILTRSLEDLEKSDVILKTVQTCSERGEKWYRKMLCCFGKREDKEEQVELS